MDLFLELKGCLLFINTSLGAPSREKSSVKWAMMSGVDIKCKWKEEYSEN